MAAPKLLSSDGMLWPWPTDYDGRYICLSAERMYRSGFLKSAHAAQHLIIDNDNPKDDIHRRLKLNWAWEQRRLCRDAFNNKKLRRLEIDAYHTDQPARLNHYRSQSSHPVRLAFRLAYWRGRVHALEYIKQSYFDAGFPEHSGHRKWGYFHESMVIPWARKVADWANNPLDGKLYLPPDLIHQARQIAERERKWKPPAPVAKPKPAAMSAAVAAPKTITPAPLPASPAEIITISLADVEGKEIQWFWPNRIPAGMLTLLVGNPGVGKSFLTMYICAIVSTGRDWPDDKNTLAPGSVLLFSDEESLEYAIKPRLQSHGADCSKIFAVPHIRCADGHPEPFTIDEHIQLLREKLQKMPDCRVIIFDPITAYLGAVNANNNAEVRGALVGLQGLAQERNVTILGINHFSKKAELDAIHRILGSTGFVAAARAVWAVIQEKPDEHNPDPDPPRLLIPVKSNYSIAPTTLQFQIINKQVVFDKSSQRVDIDSILQQTKKKGGRQSNKKDAIADWLNERVGTEPVLADELQVEAESKGLTWSYVQKVANEIGIVKTKSAEHGGKSLWACGE